MIAELATWGDYVVDPAVDFNEKLDRWDAFAAHQEQIAAPLKHRFMHGLYMREILMPAGSIITSRVHRYESPFFIAAGKVIVVSENEGNVIYCAPHAGITQPGTRRILLMLEDTTWITVHPNPDDHTDVAALVDELTYINPNAHMLEVES